jgi:natural product precursor
MKKTVKLSLKKTTIQNLSNEALRNVKGGIYTIQYHPCQTNEGGCIYETEWMC